MNDEKKDNNKDAEEPKQNDTPRDAETETSEKSNEETKALDEHSDSGCCGSCS